MSETKEKKHKKEKKEEEYYPIIREKLEKLFREKGVNVYLEITARRTFSEKLKSKIPSGREIIFIFLKKAAPDITGFVETKTLPNFIVVEVKDEKIELDDIYQLKKYADLFDAKFAFLISLEPIPEEIKRLCRSPFFLLSRLKASVYNAFALGEFDKNSNEFVEWFEENPFSETIYWR